MNKKVLLIVIVAVAVGAVGAWRLTAPREEKRHKIDGTVYVLPKEFLVNLEDGRYAKLNVALVLDHGQPTAAAAGGHGAAPKPPEGYGTLEQEAVIRDIVTDVLSNEDGDQLISSEGRERIKEEILTRIRRTTDVRTDDVLITDVAVQ
jgi:flagellar basal body-associated protein FliL